ncbi:hypothetical protein MXMO3_01513 [Maritalea myrionectae]|uniref:Alpha/beta hydrolase n=2 Tax=Maritalea myrionectae TaxID=454601 RepID=A0A2R4MDJ8_9HYPH|nr:hypothetical protein MXMO3_01513 [Maritalea myrionectae]
MDWDSLKEKHSKALVDAVQERIIKGTSREIETGAFTDAGFEIRKVMALFRELHQLGVVKQEILLSCPAPNCGNPIDYDVNANPECSNCGLNFEESGERPTEVVKHFVLGQLSRDVPWLIALHGFNTLGEWHRDFGWLVSNKIKYHVPILMYQYPMSRHGVMIRSWHVKLAVELGNSIRKAMKHAKSNGITEAPDIVAHSFGSLVLVTLLDHPMFNDLRFGRIILAGGVVPPNYNFSKHIKSGKCEAVLNHCSSKDLAMTVAPWLIPASGPSGKVGIQGDGVVNVRESEYGHGTYFEEGTLRKNLASGGTWDQFLRLPTTYLHMVDGYFSPNADKWPPFWLPFTSVVRGVLIVFPIIALTLFLIDKVMKIWGAIDHIFGFSKKTSQRE